MQMWQEFCTFIVIIFFLMLPQFRIYGGDRAVYTVTFLNPITFQHRGWVPFMWNPVMKRHSEIHKMNGSPQLTEKRELLFRLNSENLIVKVKVWCLIKPQVCLWLWKPKYETMAFNKPYESVRDYKNYLRRLSRSVITNSRSDRGLTRSL
jgi:hypothetical protein